MNEVAKKYHNILAQYYNSQPLWFDDHMHEPNARKCVELPWQQTEAGLWNETANTLSDIIFIEANAKSELLDSLKALYEYALLQINDSKNREKLNAYYTVFLRQRHIIKEFPALTFQQVYNEIQWFDKFAKDHLEKNKETLTANGRTFLHQFRVPKLVSSNLVFNLTPHNGSVNAVQFSPNGKWFLSASSDATIKVWDAKFCNELATLTGHEYMINSCAYSRDGSKIISGSADKTIKIWDAVTYKEIATLRGHNKPVIACALSSDANRVVSASSDDFLKIWDANTAVELLNIEATGYFITSCAFSPDGKHILTGSKDKASQIWDAETGEKLFNLTSSQKEKPALLLEQFKGLNAKGYSDINCCGYSPDGRYIVAGKFSYLIIFDAATGEEITSFNGHDKAINSCAFSADSKMMVSGSDDNTIKVWDIATGKEIMSFVGHTSAVTSCSLSPDGKHVISGSRDKTIKYWSFSSLIQNIDLSAQPDEIKDLLLASKSKNLSPDGKYKINIQRVMVAHDEAEDCLDLKSIKTSKNIKRFWPQDYEILAASYSPNGNFIIMCGRSVITVIDTKTFKQENYSRSSCGVISCSAFSPDGRFLVTGDRPASTTMYDTLSKRIFDCTLKVWNMQATNETLILRGHTHAINCCTFSPDGKMIASASQDKTLRIWQIDTGDEISVFHAQAGITTCSFNPDGTKLSFNDEDGNLYRVNLVGFKHEPPILTAKFTFEEQNNALIEKNLVVCPYCQATINCNIPDDATFDDSRLFVHCSECGMQLKLNPFVIEMD